MKIAAYGDSTQYGSTWLNGTYIQSPQNPPRVLQELLSLDYPHVTVENRGIPGLNSVQRLYGGTLVHADGTRTTVPSWEYEMRTTDADIVINNTAINDAFVEGFTPADHSYCFGQMWFIARQHGKRFMIETPNPIDLVHNQFLAAYVPSLINLAHINRIPICDQFSIIERWWPNWWLDLPDAVHPNNELYHYMGVILHHYVKLMLSAPERVEEARPAPSRSPEDLAAAGAWQLPAQPTG